MLSCECSEYDNDDPGAWWYYEPNDFVKFSEKRRKRCSSCNDLIDIGSDCLEFKRERNSYTEIEQRIKGDEITIASIFMCEKCGEIYLNLSAVGYCLNITSDMQAAMDEYHKLTGFKNG